jgi:hypothetical protein
VTARDVTYGDLLHLPVGGGAVYAEQRGGAKAIAARGGECSSDGLTSSTRPLKRLPNLVESPEGG